MMMMMRHLFSNTEAHLLKCVVNLNVNKDGVHYLTERTGNDNLIRKKREKCESGKKVTNCITLVKER